jgi:hypothetical protein
LRVHGAPRTTQPTYFLDGRSIVELPAIDWSKLSVKLGADEMAHVGGAHLGVYFVGDGIGVVRAQRSGNSWAMAAFTWGMSDPRRFNVMQGRNLTYLKGVAAFRIESDDLSGHGGYAWLFPIRPGGPPTDPPIRVPTQTDLPDVPQACTADERANTARGLAIALPGTRHPVVVTDSVDPPRAMLTGTAVLHGTLENPCVAAYEVELVPNDAAPELEESAIVLLSDLDHAWLFKNTAPSGNPPQIEYRTMSCRFSASVEVPPETFNMPNMLAPRRK